MGLTETVLLVGLAVLAVLIAFGVRELILALYADDELDPDLRAAQLARLRAEAEHRAAMDRARRQLADAEDWARRWAREEEEWARRWDREEDR